MKYWFILFLFLASCSSGGSSNKTGGQTVDQNSQKTNKTSSNDYHYEISENSSGGFGYTIFQNGKMVIDQPTIPAIQGNRGFDSKDDAEATAQLVIKKINEGFFPPTLTIEELDSLGVI